MSLYAGMQATLHNAHFRREEGEPPFSPEMFMPGYRAPKWNWRNEAQKMKLIHKRGMTQDERQDNQATLQRFRDKSKEMDAARARGASSAELQAIMES